MVDATKALLGDFLNHVAVSTSENKIAVITNEGKYVPNNFDEDGRERLELLIDFNEESFRWTLNKDTVNNLMEAWGKETNDWVGKKVKLSVTTVNGKKTVKGEPLQE